MTGSGFRPAAPEPTPNGTPPTALTVAGSDSGAGAGIQADLKVFAALGVYGTSVITALTAQNTHEVRAVHPAPPAMVTAQLDAVLADLPVVAVKTGMLGTVEIAEAVAAQARAGRLPNLVVDPVLVSTSGHRLGVVEAVARLLPYALVVTPNREEAAALLGRPVRTWDEMASAAADLAALGPRHVVVTGGGDGPAGDTGLAGGARPGADAGSGAGPDAGPGMAVDAFWDGRRVVELAGPWVPTRNTHGTGCSFAAAITARIALGDPVADAVVFAKQYVARALAGGSGWRLGGGHGPLDHFGWSR